MMMFLSSSSLSSYSDLYNNNLVSISSSPSSNWDHFHGRKSFFLDLNSSRRKHQHQHQLLKSRCQLQLLDVSSSPAAASAASYGALLLAGGLFAYTRSGSKSSLIGGLVGSSSMAVLLWQGESLDMFGSICVALMTRTKNHLVTSAGKGIRLKFLAFILMQSPETKPIGDSLAFGSSLLFTFVFGIRLAATRKAIPAGLLLGLSIGALAVFVSAYLQDTQPLSNVM